MAEALYELCCLFCDYPDTEQEFKAQLLMEARGPLMRFPGMLMAGASFAGHKAVWYATHNVAVQEEALACHQRKHSTQQRWQGWLLLKKLSATPSMGAVCMFCRPTSDHALQDSFICTPCLTHLWHSPWMAMFWTFTRALPLKIGCTNMAKQEGRLPRRACV